MPHIQVIINQHVEFSGVLDHWTGIQPDFLKNQIKPNQDPAPWFKAVAIAFADAINGSANVIIEARHSAGEWAVRCKEAS